MSKILKPYTIIPSSLYVKRDADRQIENIISDMGRPGYVLVSRQMGKTNLLLNAKRNLETVDDIFLYIDLSNPFDDARSCFENIIDSALDINADKIGGASNQIFLQRNNSTNIPAHKQHLNELRILLNLIPGKLIVILDEIDALTKTTYSDQIFAQIRSVYFSRVNYPELDRLSYVLSGVVEPTEIIKDPKISPFNIGQKIYLNDFSKAEFRLMLVQANLVLEEQIADRIFYWTNGNPRMTWDLCSEIEDMKLIQSITLDDVDKLVRDLYLTTFDKPPIDNIRELTKNDREIRNALVEIFYNKGQAISDRTKSKLYLSGIINYEESQIAIKNKIIEESISLNWIKSLQSEDVDLIAQAQEYYHKQNFVETIASFRRYLLDNVFDEEIKNVYYYQMGYSAYRLSDFPASAEYLNHSNFDSKDEAKMYCTVLHLRAIVQHYLGDVDGALANLKIVIDSGRTDEIYIRSLINYCTFSIASGDKEQQKEAEEVYNDILSSEKLSSSRLSEKSIAEIKSIAFFNLAQIQNKNSDKIQAVLSYKEAIVHANENSKPVIKLKLIKVLENKNEQTDLVESIVDYVLSTETTIFDFDPEDPTRFSIDDFKSIIAITFLFHDELFRKLIPKVNSIWIDGITNMLYETGLDLSADLSMNRSSDLFFEKLYLLTKRDPVFKTNSENEIAILRILAYTNSSELFINYHLDYLNALSAERFQPMDFIDMEIFVNAIQILHKQNRLEDALYYAQIIKAFRDQIPKDIWVNYFPIYHLELIIFAHKNDRPNMLRRAKEILSLSEDPKIMNQHTDFMSKKMLDTIIRDADSLINPIFMPPQLIKQELPKNSLVKVRYTNGKIVTQKFKRLEKDITSGKCVVLNT